MASVFAAVPASAREDATVARAFALIINATGQVVGTADLTQTPDGMRIQVSVDGLPPGVHGTHIHAVARCIPPSFTSAGGHFNPFGKKHGLESPDGPHAGDLPNLTVATDGKGSLDYVNALVSLGPGTTSLFDADGSAIVIHANQDDQKTDPIGNSGPRIACGVIKPSYAFVLRGSKGQAGGSLHLSVGALGLAPRFPDNFIESVAGFGYTWGDTETNRTVVVVLHPALGRDSHQNPSGWHTHPAMTTNGTAQSDFCVAGVGTSEAGISVTGDGLRIVAPGHMVGLTADEVDFVASFEVHRDSGCASGLGIIGLTATSLSG